MPIPTVVYKLCNAVGYDVYARCLSAVCLMSADELAKLTESPPPEPLPPTWSPLEKLVLVVCPSWVCVEGQLRLWRRSAVEGILNSFGVSEAAPEKRVTVPFHLRTLPFESIKPEEWSPQPIRDMFTVFAQRIRAGLIVRGSSDSPVGDNADRRPFLRDDKVEAPVPSHEEEKQTFDAGDSGTGTEQEGPNPSTQPAAVTPSPEGNSTPPVGDDSSLLGYDETDGRNTAKAAASELEMPIPPSQHLAIGQEIARREGIDIEYKLSARVDQVRLLPALAWL